MEVNNRQKTLEEERPFNEYEAAAYLGLAVQTLRNRRYLRLPPAFMKIGKAVRYRREDLDAYKKIIWPRDRVRTTRF